MRQIKPPRRSTLPVSEVEQVAALEIGECHWKVKEAKPEDDMTAEEAQIVLKRRMSSAATTTIGRVQDRHPDRAYSTTVAAFIAADRKTYVGVGITRNKDRGIIPHVVRRTGRPTSN